MYLLASFVFPEPEIVFCDNSFNVPKSHAEAICREIIDLNMDIEWCTMSLKPIGITEELCKLFKD